MQRSYSEFARRGRPDARLVRTDVDGYPEPAARGETVTRLHETFETPLSTDEAFAFVADFANAQHWDPGVATSERIDAGPVGVGARYRLGVRMRGKVAPMEYRITTYEAPRRVVLEGTGSNITAVDEIRFAPLATGAAGTTGTRIDYTADIRLGGWMRLVQPFAGGAFRRLANDAIGGMRAALDARAAAKEAAR